MTPLLSILLTSSALASAGETFPALQFYKAPTTEQARLQAMKNALQPSGAGKKSSLSHLSLTPITPQMAKAERHCAIPLTTIPRKQSDAPMVHRSELSADQTMAKSPFTNSCGN